MFTSRYFGLSGRDPLQIVYKDAAQNRILSLTRIYGGNPFFKIKWTFEENGYLINLSSLPKNSHRDHSIEKGRIISVNFPYRNEEAEAITFSLSSWLSELERFTDFSFTLALQKQYQELARLGHLNVKKLLKDRKAGVLRQSTGLQKHPELEMSLPEINGNKPALDLLEKIAQNRNLLEFRYNPRVSAISYKASY